MTGTIDARTTVLLASEALLLWPRGESQHVDPAVADLWPVFAVVVDDRHLRRAPGGRALQGRIDGRHSFTLLDGVARWQVLTADAPLLGLTVRAEAPVPVGLDLVIPAKSLVGELGRLAAGPTVGITTSGRAAALAAGADVRTALRVLALARSAPCPELTALAAP
ncbi:MULTISPECIES: hypothetical protein [Actinokineospora]|uniref:Uncharacterized protein n=1 Tax=Actinokineospora fastidiosa TaxID=1816 RepID=A0A918GF92_9PSEU|nr:MULTISPECIES: hypothetical protein [Actinokineospora]UVS79978.1 hypothetical protein Actkin_03728 [Actinokineospora sp. UTMC 2448]GGS32220.1 hypothetical protein GCM10010171_27710 [Actinokineospora fastidiosa]